MLLFKVFKITINHREHRNCLESDETLTWLYISSFMDWKKNHRILKGFLDYDGEKH